MWHRKSKLSCTAAGACRRCAARDTTNTENRQQPWHNRGTCRYIRIAIDSIRTPQVSPNDERNAASTNLNQFCHVQWQHSKQLHSLTNTPSEYVEDDKAELSDVETFASWIWQLMQRVSREIALDKPNDMNDQTWDPTIALIAPPWTCKTNTQHKQGNYITLTLTPKVEIPDSVGQPLHVKATANLMTLTGESLGKWRCWISDKHR